MRLVDLRSDTLTRPTAEMRRAMAEAEVGDDVFGEDPTVNRLERMAAERTGKEAALFVASGTMANLVSILAHCGRGDEIILGDQAHAFYYEQGGYASLGGVHGRPIPNRADGTLDPDLIEASIRPDDVHFPKTRLIALENTHNRCGGYPLSVDYMRRVRQIADRSGLKIHVDGARIFNASVALKVEVSSLVSDADSVSFCLSKGLGAPVGSLVCGSKDFIKQARRLRKVVGGGMRQAGVLAAAGIVALTKRVERLEEDHANARLLAEGLSRIPGLLIDPGVVRTNIVFFELGQEGSSAKDFAEHLGRAGVLVLAAGPKRIRAVTNHHITGEDIEYVLDVFRKVAGS